jgi:hypothetical protein
MQHNGPVVKLVAIASRRKWFLLSHHVGQDLRITVNCLCLAKTIAARAVAGSPITSVTVAGIVRVPKAEKWLKTIVIDFAVITD